MAQPMTWFFLALCLLVTGRADAQPQPPGRQRQDRRTSLPATPAEPLPELYLAGGNLTTVLLNRPLDRDSLSVDRTRFKWVDVGDRTLSFQLAEDLEPGEQLLIKIGFKDREQPSQAIFAAVTHPTVMDGHVEVERRANSPEALLSALAQKEAELEELKSQCQGSGLTGVALSGWFKEDMQRIPLQPRAAPANSSSLMVTPRSAYAFEGTSSVVMVIGVRNLPGQPPWAVGRAHLTSAAGTAIAVLSVQQQPPHLAPGEEGLVALETKIPEWESGEVLGVELVDASGQRRLSFNLSKK
ncbi:MAG TPA: DUF2381 family protein [Myxococcaceae bacterium]